MAASVDLEYPFASRWRVQNSPASVQNSPANRVPSHGTPLFATSYSIDFVPVDDTGRTAPITIGSLMRPESPERFWGFGRPLLAPVAGVVVAAYDTEPDHRAYRGLPSIGYALTQRRRARAGWIGLAGNHVLIESGGVVLAFSEAPSRSELDSACRWATNCVAVGTPATAPSPMFHLQAIDNRDAAHANAVPLTFRGSLPRNGEVVIGQAERHRAG